MKKTILTFIAVAGLSISATAQGKGDVEFGFQAGYNVSSISDSEVRSDSGNGFNLGASADYYFSKSWSIKVKAIYDQKGWDNGFITDLDTGIDYETNYNLNYLTVPVMAGWHFGNSENWYLNFGPYVGFLLNAKETRFDLDVKDGFLNSTDIGLAVGIGVKIPLNDKLRLFIEYEGQGGFSDIFEHNEDEAVTNSRSSFNIGLNFKMK